MEQPQVEQPIDKVLVIGVDVGGTNTDAVILKGHQVLAQIKHPTTKDRTSGVRGAIEKVIDGFVYQNKQFPTRKGVISCTLRVNIGTTHFVNALIERKNLQKVGVLRLCGSASVALPPFTDFPEYLKREVCGGYKLVDGGFECTRQEISNINKEQIVLEAQDLYDSGIRFFVVCGIFSPLVHRQESEVAEIIRSVYPDVSITQSHMFNQLGLLERESAAILNESLKNLCHDTITAFRQALDDVGFPVNCPFYLSQNDGTLISEMKAKELPVLTISSGPTNSMRGAAFLSGVQDAVVIDIGGTTTDVGVIKSGFPREASGYSKLPGVDVRTKFRHPDVISIGLGGGSIIRCDNNNVVLVGPDSVGHQLQEEAISFGGNVTTATDVAMATGLLAPFGTAKVPQTIGCQTTYAASMQIYKMIGDTIDAIKTSSKDVPVLLVGGGSVLVDTDNWVFKGVSVLQRTPHFDVANAVGAAIGQVSGEYRDMVSLSSPEDRDRLIDEAITKAREQAIANGANPDTITVIERSIDPVPYVGEAGKFNVVNIYIKVVGDLLQDDDKKVDITTTNPVVTKPQLPTTGHDKIERTDNPHWPYENEEVKKLDTQFGLPDPVINSSGEWVLTVQDVECLCIGAGILGCGGGGSPYFGELLAKKEINNGKEIKVVNPLRLDPSQQGLCAPVAFMGAPTIFIEKAVSGTETLMALEALKKLLASGVCEEANNYGKKSVGVVEVKQSTKCSGVFEATGWEKVDLSTQISEERRITSLFCCEVGGANSVEPLLVGAKCGLPVLDADGMGRAFPELQMFAPFIYNSSPYPCCAADHKGNIVAISHAESAKQLENVMRMACVEMGFQCSITLGSLTVDDVKNMCMLHTLSKAWCLGRAVRRGQLAKTDPAIAVTTSVNGRLIINGKIIDIHRATEGGFNRGYLIIQGLGKFSGSRIRILFQNENLVAHFDDGSDTMGKIIVTTPALISVLDSDKGEPITTEEVKYGIRIAVVAMEPDPQLTTKRALEVVGPKAFGYDFDYVPYDGTV